MELWELSARESIRETEAAYSRFVDSGRFDELLALFSEDAQLDIDGEMPLVGRAAIRSYLSRVGEALAKDRTVPLIRHMTSNLHIAVASPEEARAECYFVAITEEGVDHWGRYRDRLVPFGDRWVFTYRRVRTDGMRPDGWAAHRAANR